MITISVLSLMKNFKILIRCLSVLVIMGGASNQTVFAEVTTQEVVEHFHKLLFRVPTEQKISEQKMSENSAKIEVPDLTISFFDQEIDEVVNSINFEGLIFTSLDKNSVEVIIPNTIELTYPLRRSEEEFFVVIDNGTLLVFQNDAGVTSTLTAEAIASGKDSFTGENEGETLGFTSFQLNDVEQKILLPSKGQFRATVDSSHHGVREDRIGSTSIDLSDLRIRTGQSSSIFSETNGEFTFAGKINAVAMEFREMVSLQMDQVKLSFDHSPAEELSTNTRVDFQINKYTVNDPFTMSMLAANPEMPDTGDFSMKIDLVANASVWDGVNTIGVETQDIQMEINGDFSYLNLEGDYRAYLYEGKYAIQNGRTAMLDINVKNLNEYFDVLQSSGFFEPAQFIALKGLIFQLTNEKNGMHTIEMVVNLQNELVINGINFGEVY